MKKWTVYLYVFVIALLAGCANAPVADKQISSSAKTPGKPNNPQTAQKSEADVVDDAIAKADLAYKANKPEEAATVLNQVATEYPQEKRPWKRLAQAEFDAENYGKAIEDALEVLKRDPKDQVASSIIVVSGLRVSTKSLADLKSQNGISGTLKTEATELARILSENLGEQILVAKSHKPVYHKKIKSHTASEDRSTKYPEPAKSADSGNPFGVLK